jgi:Peptidase family M1 domain
MDMAIARRLFPLVLVALLLASTVPAAADDDPVRNPGEPSYRVRLATGPAGRVWRGTQRISFTNLDADPLSLIYLRLWSNGVEGCRAHAIVVTEVEGGTPGDPSERCTVLPIELDAPVASGERATVGFRLTIDLPRRNDRFGVYRGLSLLGTALPTLAIHDDAGWHLPPFVDLGESFYSIVGEYTVTLSVPRGLDTPTTGVAVAEVGTPQRRITTYRAQDVRDFAWAAGHLSRVRGRSGSTGIVVWYQRDGLRRARAVEALRNARRSLDAFSEAFGTFPYPEMDVVLTAFATFGGMEYPTIIFTNPDRLTVAHELAHQWWYGLVGDDEYTEPWLDESFATWSQYLPFDGWRTCPDGPSFPSDTARTTNDMGYWRTHMDEYWVIYAGGGCLLADLADRLGFDRFVEVLRGYAQAHWLGVARTADFTAAVEAAAAEDGLDFDADAYWSAWRVDRPA